MDELMNRSRGLAEGVVVMICPVLLALALNKVDLNGEVYGHGVPIIVLIIAGVTLISGICPMLACCCFPKRSPGANVWPPAPVLTSPAILSSSFLLILASWIAQFVVSKPTAITFGVLFGVCIVGLVARTVRYHLYHPGNAPQAPGIEEFHDILDESHEFLTGLTGILFLGLEGLALQGHNQIVGPWPPIISLIFCALGVCLMFLEMTPPTKYDRKVKIAIFTLVLDSIMAAGTLAVLVAVMFKLMRRIALMLLVLPLGIILELVFRVAVNRSQGGNIQAERRLESNPASLELTKVTFTGFLAVSATAISKDSPNNVNLTGWFLMCAAAAIVFGLSWRILSQIQIRRVLVHRASSDAIVASCANTASFFAHLCIVIATILLVVMAWRASGK